jgi:hypothetical protein
VKLIGHKKLLSFGLVYGAGPKVFGVAILDEVLAIYALFGRLLTGKLVLANSHWTERMLVACFLLMTLTGALYTQNINTLRFFVIGIFLFFHSPRATFHISSMIVGAKAFLVSYFVIVFVGYSLNLPTAFWQDGLWTGTTYAAVFSCVSAWLCILFAKNIVNTSFILFLYLSIAVLADSRLQLLLTVVLVPTVFARFQREHGARINYRKVLRVSMLLVVTSLIVSLAFGLAAVNSFQSVGRTLLGLAIGDEERDADRMNSIKASLNWAADHPFKLIAGSGVLAHQTELAKYYPPSSYGDGKIRPVGASAMIVDGGIVLSSLILLNAFVTFLRIRRARVPMFLKLGATLVLVLVLSSIIITNLFDAILFWLIIMPSGVLPFVLQEWSSPGLVNGRRLGTQAPARVNRA